MINIVILLVIVAAGVGVLGYYSSGFADWSTIQEALGINYSDEQSFEESEPPTKSVSYSRIYTGDTVSRLYFNKDVDLKIYLSDTFQDAQWTSIPLLGFGSGQPYINNSPRNEKVIALVSGAELNGVNGNEWSEEDVALVCIDGSTTDTHLWDYSIIYSSKEGWTIEENFLDINSKTEVFPEMGLPIVVTEIYAQNIFRAFMSTDNIFSVDSISEKYVEIVKGDILSTIFFNTAYNLKELYDADALNLISMSFYATTPSEGTRGPEVRIMALPGYAVTRNFDDADEIFIILTIRDGENYKYEIVYSSMVTSTPYGDVTEAGWQKSSYTFNDAVYMCGGYFGQNIGRTIISSNDVFAEF